jgi:hypothetical protein
VAVIPGGMTPPLQPADTHWNKPFKTEMKRRWRDWLLQGEHEYTKSGKRKRASYNLVAQWVSDSWKDVPHNLISRSFLESGLSHFSSHGLEELHSKLRVVVEEGTTAPEEE